MSAFRDRLLEFYEKNPNFVVPTTRMKEVIQHVSAGLSDLSISRPVERLSWGIPVPDDSTQIIYVWLDALINYLTKSNYPLQRPGMESADGWPADCHVIGKDIVRYVWATLHDSTTNSDSTKFPLCLLASILDGCGSSSPSPSLDTCSLDSWPLKDV